MVRHNTTHYYAHDCNHLQIRLQLKVQGVIMPPVFNESSFKFEEGEQVPDHVEGYAGGAKDPSKYHLDGFDTFDGEDYPLARDIDDLPTAQMLHTARMRQLEETQFSSSSGGQSGIQDRVYVVHPKTNQ